MELDLGRSSGIQPFDLPTIIRLDHQRCVAEDYLLLANRALAARSMKTSDANWADDDHRVALFPTSISPYFRLAADGMKALRPLVAGLSFLAVGGLGKAALHGELRPIVSRAR